MRILIVGAGATGGAFGARLQEAGRDVTYLVRAPRAAQLAHGLRFVAPDGDRTLAVATITADDEAPTFDLVLVAVKATGLEAALHDAARFVGPRTRVVPILNGMRHIDLVRERGLGVPVGGSVKIVATLDDDGSVVQMTPLSTMTIGALDDRSRDDGPTLDDVAQALDVPGIDLTVSDDIVGDLWDKWAFIAAAGVVTCLFRNTVGHVVAAGGEDHVLAAIDETVAVAGAAGHPTSGPAREQARQLLTEPGSSFTSSLYRDLVAGHATEAEHLLGDLQDRARALGVATPLLDLTLVQVRAAELSRQDRARR